MKTFFQSEEPTDIEKRALKQVDKLFEKYGSITEVKYAAIDAMIWLSSQPEIQGRAYRRAKNKD